MGGKKTGANLFAPLEAMFRSLEKMCSVNICVHDLRGWTLLNGRRQLPPKRYIHLHPFCMKVKANGEGRRLCGQSDYHRANARGFREKTSFLKKCHAGVWEMAFPLIRGEQIVGSIFCGLCRKTARMPKWPWADQDRAELGSLYRALPMTDERPMREIGRMLQATVPVMLENILGLLGARRDSSKDKILEWIAQNYQRAIDVRCLAGALNLSPSRTAHLVRERTGLSFGRLISSFRINEAKNLLRLTDDRITDIAHKTGFDDSNYFSRVFARQEDLSPRRFRKQSHLVDAI